MKHALPRLSSVTLPASVLLSLGLAHAQSSVQLATPPMIPSRTPVAAAPAAGTGSASAIATCLPAIRDQSGAGCIQASSVPTFGDLLPMSNYFNVTPAAQVGIGTASPAATLHMLAQIGYAEVIQDGPNGARNRYRQGGAPTWDIYAGLNDYAIGRSGIDFPFLIELGSGNTLMNQGAGSVGIGTSTPTPGFKLDVNGSALVQGNLNLLSQIGYAEVIQDGTGGARNRYRQGGAPTWDIYVGSADYAIGRSGIDFPFRIELGSGNTLMNQGAGSVGIGTSTPTPGFKLDVAGNVRCVSLTQTSAREFKQDIAPLTGALASLLKLQGVTYSWNDKAPEAVQGHADIGFIADDVDAVLPEIVSKDESGKVLGLDYGKITPVAVEAIKELNAKNVELSAMNVALEARLAKLEALFAGQTK